MIGIFDSGIGGVTILKEILKENFDYPIYIIVIQKITHMEIKNKKK